MKNKFVLITVGSTAWWLSASPGDLSRLDSYAQKYRIETLIDSLEQPANDEPELTFVVLGDTR